MEQSERIRALNDAFRRGWTGKGTVYVTSGIAALPRDERASILARVRAFDEFDEGNDPYGEHDFGSFERAGKTIFWKIDCYDRAMQWGSPNPADPTVTHRVLTVMLAEEY
jgi:hypothetical protein